MREGISQRPNARLQQEYADLPIQFFEPPNYDREVRASSRMQTGSGAIAVVSLSAGDFRSTAFPGTIDCLRRLERSAPRITVIASLLDWKTLHFEEGYSLLRILPISAVASSPPPISSSVVCDLVTMPLLVIPNVVRWFRTHVASDGPPDYELLRMLVGAGYHAFPSDRLTATKPRVSGTKPLSVPSRDWFHLGRGLRSVVALQRRAARGDSHEQVGFSLGFSAASSFSRHLNNVFGRRPSFIAPRPGYAWLLAEWTEEHMGVCVESTVDARDRTDGGLGHWTA